MERDFNGSLALSIKEALTSLLGSKIYDALSFHLLKFYDITPEEFPYRLDTLDTALRRNFGSSFTVIEKAVVRNFYARLGLEFVNQQGYGLQHYVEDAKRRLAHVSNSPNQIESSRDT